MPIFLIPGVILLIRLVLLLIVASDNADRKRKYNSIEPNKTYSDDMINDIYRHMDNK